MANVLESLVKINDVDIYKQYSAFLVEDKRGGMENLMALLTPSKLKSETSVDIREEHGEKNSQVLTPRNEARDVELNFAITKQGKAEWLKTYITFIEFLKEGKNGWLDFELPQLDLHLHMRYQSSTKFTPLTYLWREGMHAGKFKVKFREPRPII